MQTLISTPQETHKDKRRPNGGEQDRRGGLVYPEMKCVKVFTNVNKGSMRLT